jgi:hypothetical protein
MEPAVFRNADCREGLCRVPKIKDAKFGRKVSAIGDGTLKYTGVRIVHAQFDADPLV